MTTSKKTIFDNSELYGRHMQQVRPWPDIIQLEITSICNLRCVMCPITCEKRDRAPDERVLSLEDLRGIREVFDNAYEVELTGFGEVFTHPDLLNILRFFRETGCTINATTNGMLMKPEMSEAIVKENLIDLLCISMDAATQETLGKIRVGAKMDQILENAKALQEMKKRHREKSPRLHLSFITMDQNLDELPDFVRLAADLQAQEVIVQGLCAGEFSAVTNTARDPEHEAAIYREAHSEAQKLGVAMEFWYQGNTETGDSVQTDGKTLRKYQVTSRPDGVTDLVKDCPFPWDRVFLKSNLDVQICATLWEEMVMGNLRNQTFQEIWLGEKYKDARDRMRSTNAPEACVKCMTKHWRAPLLTDDMSGEIDFGDLYAKQLGLGLYPMERDENGRGHRWAHKKFTFFLKNAGRKILEMELYFHPDAPRIKGEVHAGGHFLGRLDSKTHWSSPARFAVPDIQDDVLQIDVEFDREWRSIQHGLPGGYRPLSVMLYGAALADGPSPLQAEATAGKAGDDQFIAGWYDPENHFGKAARWSQEEGSLLLATGTGSEIELQMFNLPGVPSRNVEAFIDGNSACRFTTSGKPGIQKFSFKAPKTSGKWQVLRFVVENAWSPSETGDSADTRQLGLLLHSAKRKKPLLHRLLGGK